MEHKNRFETIQANTFEYRGKSYRTAHEGGIVIHVEKRCLPKVLARVLPDEALTFDENDILAPKSKGSSNDMVSLSSNDEWEKFARMFHVNKKFRVVSVNAAGLIGPTFLAGNRILRDGETLSLVPKSAIIDEKRFSWTKAEADYDYGQGDYTDDYDRDFYQRLVVNRSMGLKPIEIK